MKKFLFPIVFSIVVVLFAGLIAYATPDEKVIHIQQTFQGIAQKFYKKATLEHTGAFFYVMDETNPNKRYYLTADVAGSVNASLQVELENNAVMIYAEGLRFDYENKKHTHYLNSRLIYRDGKDGSGNGADIENIAPSEGIWDTVLNKLFQ